MGFSFTFAMTYASSVFLLSSMFLLCICSSFTSSVANLLGNDTDKLALLAFKSHITLNPSQILKSWNESNHFCQWEGVVCGHKHQRVTELDLRSRGLVGSISPHIGNLSFLRGLFLLNNSFQGDIPANIGKLSRLEYLVLHDNSLVGEIPVNLSFCSNLKYIYLYNNKLHGNIPTELGYLQKLISLGLFMNELVGGIPLSLRNLTALNEIDLSSNNLNGNIPSTLGELKKLQFLTLSSNELSGVVPPSLYNLSNIEVLILTDNHLTGELPSDIGLTLPAVKTFAISGNNFSGPIPISLFNASKLEKIDVAENQFIGKILLVVGHLKNLQLLNMDNNSLGGGKQGDLNFVTSLNNCSQLYQLDIGYNYFGGTMPTSVGNHSIHLRYLYLGGNLITGNIPTQIGNLQELTLLGLEVNFFSGFIPSSFGNMKNLQILNIAYNKLSGYLPSTKNMSNLYELHLRNNLLEGTISPALENQVLQYIILSHNKFSGPIPKEIGQSSRLLEVQLASNLLNGSIPAEVGNLQNLYTFSVSRNDMSGEIPNTLTSCLSLQDLYLGGNSFNGPLPSSMNSLGDLRFLNLSDNTLSGPIPKELQKLGSLVYLNMSFNDFEGEVPIQGIFLNTSGFSIVGNPKICGGISRLHLPKCHIQRSKKQQSKLYLKVPLGAVVIVVVTYLMRKSQSKASYEQSGLDRKRVSFLDLHRATNRFSSENLIGTGRYGFVYKGIHRQGELIAVKVVNLVESRAIKTFLAECEALRVIRHRNLLKMLTVCSSVDFNGNDFKALVFKFMLNGSLDSWLHPVSETENEPRYLTFHQRLNIAIDVASALDYLHNHCGDPVIHCDLKPNNVLLGDDFTAHVGDFGLAKFLSTTSTLTSIQTSSIFIRGTIGYIPPEYGAGGNVSTQGDVYSYGILLLEMFTGKRPTDPGFKDGLTLHMYSQMDSPQRVMEIVDVRMLSEFCDETTRRTNHLKESVISIMEIGVACSLDLSAKRMSIKTALTELISIKRNCT